MKLTRRWSMVVLVWCVFWLVAGLAVTAAQAAPPFSGRVVGIADGDTLTVSGVSAASAQGGSVALVAGGVLYTPATNFTGTDSFSITISDGRGGSVSGTVNVTVANGNDPSANQASIVINGDSTVDVVFYGIPGRSYDIQRSTDLQNWTVMQAVSAAANGIVPWHDPSPPPGTAFYRTRETPAP